MRIIGEEAVAIVVDYQERLVPAMRDGETVVHNTEILLKGLRELGVPMYATQQYTKGLGETVETIQASMVNQGEAFTHIEKITFSAYEDIKAYVSGKKYVIICGIEAHICVLQTLIDLAEAGYVPVLVMDCISSRKENDMKYALERAKQEGAIITTYESILFELLKVAGNETSKKIQKLIK